jgi:hypothetical protein
VGTDANGEQTFQFAIKKAQERTMTRTETETGETEFSQDFEEMLLGEKNMKWKTLDDYTAEQLTIVT